MKQIWPFLKKRKATKTWKDLHFKQVKEKENHSTHPAEINNSAGYVYGELGNHMHDKNLGPTTFELWSINDTDKQTAKIFPQCLLRFCVKGFYSDTHYIKIEDVQFHKYTLAESFS